MSDLPTLRRDDLAQFFGSNPRFMSAMERHGEAVQEVLGEEPEIDPDGEADDEPEDGCHQEWPITIRCAGTPCPMRNAC